MTGPGRSDDDDRVRRGPAGHEGEHFLALRVEPLHIVGQDGDRLVRRDRGEHVNRGQRDEEGFGWGAFLEPERRQQRPAMRRAQLLLRCPQYGTQELMQPGEGQLTF